MHQVSYKLETPSKTSEHVLRHLLIWCGYQPQSLEQSSNELVDLYYGDPHSSIQRRVTIQRNAKAVVDLRPDEVVIKELLAMTTAFEESTLPWDIVAACEYLMLDLGNVDRARDQHQRVSAAESFELEMQVLNDPAINRYVLFLQTMLQKQLNKATTSLLPEGKRCAIILSHDVDGPDKRELSSKRTLRVRAASKALKRMDASSFARQSIGLLMDHVRALTMRQDFWLFSQIMDEESRHNMSSTFFFASRNKLNEHAHDPIDVAYNINERKYANVFREMRQRGFEIGLHASYNAFNKADYFKEEIKWLSHASEYGVLGCRHHYWHLGPNENQTLVFHEQAGLKYDSSIAFNDQMGFRRSLGLPYLPWSDDQSRAINVLQIPSFLMDGNFFYHGKTVEEALAAIKQQLKIIKQVGGICSLDWHVRTSLPLNEEYREWGRCYKMLLSLLAEDSEIWVTNFADVYEQVKDRYL